MAVDPTKTSATKDAAVSDESTNPEIAVVNPSTANAEVPTTTSTAPSTEVSANPTPSGQLPSVGRIVHYVLPDSNHTGEHRPAIIVKVWGDENGNPQPDSLVNLQVFTDSFNDYITAHPGGSGILWRTSIHHDEDTKEPGTYHFPERV